MLTDPKNNSVLAIPFPTPTPRAGTVAVASDAIALCLLAALLLVPWRTTSAAPTVPSTKTSAQIEFFEKSIRPVLVRYCYECHSAAAKKIKGGLRLDSRPGWATGGDSGPAIIPGKPNDSLLIQGIRWNDPDFQMPPKNQLPDSAIDDLVKWVEIGAPDPRNTETTQPSIPIASATNNNHWAYQPLETRAPPKTQPTSWSRGRIDQFILAKLAEHGLRPASDADRATLARRLYFDLTGLPPTPEQVDDLVSNPSQDAIAKLVDELMASPRFGEKWARHWLDVARFAESVTLRGFIFKEAWRYRDYVIQSFNQDRPFDQFITEQIAGDLLPHTTLAQRRRQLIATTFLSLGDWNLENQDKKTLAMDVVDEQLDTIGKAFLGQTIGCARCHDHKFDPIPTRDYYAMAGILRSTTTLTHANVSKWIETPLPLPPDQQRILAAHQKSVATLESEIKATRQTLKQLAGKSGELESGKKDKPGKPLIVAPEELPGIIVDSAQAKRIGKWHHSVYSKHFIGDGYWHDNDENKGEKTLSFIPELPEAGRYEVRLAYVHAPNRASNIPVTIFHADGETLVTLNQREAPVVQRRFVSLGLFRFEDNRFGHVLVSNEGTDGVVSADAVQFLPEAQLANNPQPPAGSTSPPDNSQIVTTPSASQLASKVQRLESQLKQLNDQGPKEPKAMSVVEGKSIADAPIHIRGEVSRVGPIVPRGFLTVATHSTPPTIPASESGRRQFAQWIVSPDNPLTARVIVNRVWLWLFREGIVRTPDNFGTTGDLPSHPELLDHLAAEFIENGWSLKRLIREIVLSRTYQLSSATTPLTPSSDIAHPSTVDPGNRLLWRMNRRRLTAEELRDAMLLSSASLQLPAGGQTYPPNRNSDFGFVCNEPYRSIYLPVFRNALPELFEAFDFAPPSLVTGRRNVSTVPTQALLLLNHPFVHDQAKNTASQLLARPINHEDRIGFCYRLLLGRPPSPQEHTLTSAHLNSLAEKQNPAEAWTEIVHALFASSDFRYLD